jgi:hypothetical protein
MGFAGSDKVWVYPKMDFQHSTLKPATTPSRKVNRLGNFRNPEKVGIENASLGLLTGGHGKLNVIEVPYLVHRYPRILEALAYGFDGSFAKF